ncbi:DUF1801 domain-containing protein [Sphingomonas baiyangensis]|uniref:DUF1801 domain-containing protein n=1 Tax=Sphingomonas baiyangensis TaxID=2572576 RepID=A0A4U1LA77_9SPHN|nr:DUF1801 domain-containing protein [Sphingomonas baiyangensis]TKD53385.1 DUF1801 domain-containing protein [Sphingomonas baiyangensis]
MAENKTKPTPEDVNGFIAAVPDAARRTDAERLAALFARVTGEPATMWGGSIIGYGRYRYRYDSGREGESCRVGFSPRKAECVLYVGAGRPEQADNLARLGKHRLGKGCLYLKRVTDADLPALEAIVATAYSAKAEGEVEG